MKIIYNIIHKSYMILTFLLLSMMLFMLYSCSDAEDIASDLLGTIDRVPGVPQSVAAVAENGKVTVNWNAPADTGIINGDGTIGIITKYMVYYSTTAGFSLTDTGISNMEQTNPSTTSLTVTGLTNGVQYYFVVTALNLTGESAKSNQVSSMPEVVADKVPGVPQLNTATVGSGAVTITWDAPADTGIINGDGTLGIITKYVVHYSTTTGFSLTDAGVSNMEQTNPSTTSLTVTGLTNGIQYYFVVTAFNLTGESAKSNQISAQPSIPILNNVLSDWQLQNEIVSVTEGTAVTTVDELKQMSADGVYYLNAHIDLGGTAWTPLHTSAAPFTGTLHGNGYIIYNLNIDAPATNYQGLFAVLNNATISNIGIGVIKITAGSTVGALAGYAYGTSALTNIAVTAMSDASIITVSGSFATVNYVANHTGGLVGYLGANSSLTKAQNLGLDITLPETTDQRARIGGLVGYSAGTIEGGFSNANISSHAGRWLGGLVGYNQSGNVTGSSEGDVSSVSGNDIGGLVGENSTGVITGSAKGNVSSQSGLYVGGLVGSNGGRVIGSAVGNVHSDSGTHVGGLIGNEYGHVTGVASGTVTSVSGQYIGGLAGQTQTAADQYKGYSLGWVMVGASNANFNVGAVAGLGSASNCYFTTAGGDHVGTLDLVSASKINGAADGVTGERGTNGIGKIISGIADATETNMSALTSGTAVGEWTFTAGQWPKLNLPDGVIDYMDYTAAPSAPTNFVD